MSHHDIVKIFDEKMVRSYDEKNANISEIKEALHLCMRMIFLALPENARILCVGAGTGTELLNLAAANQKWSFTVVEPAPEMMARCQQQAEKLGITSRCTYHKGFIDTLPNNGLFDAATSILVLHFIEDDAQRRQYFTNIAKLIKPEGILVNADVSTDLSGQSYQNLLSVWNNMKAYAGMPIEVNGFGKYKTLPSAEKIESLLTASGLNHPVLFYQSFLIRAWFSKTNK